MTDLILLLILAVFGIIGYRLMGLVDRSIDRHTAGNDKPEQEKETDEYAKAGESEDTHSGMPFFFHIKR